MASNTRLVRGKIKTRLAAVPRTCHVGRGGVLVFLSFFWFDPLEVTSDGPNKATFHVGMIIHTRTPGVCSKNEFARSGIPGFLPSVTSGCIAQQPAVEPSISLRPISDRQQLLSAQNDAAPRPIWLA